MIQRKSFQRKEQCIPIGYQYCDLEERHRTLQRVVDTDEEELKLRCRGKGQLKTKVYKNLIQVPT